MNKQLPDYNQKTVVILGSFVNDSITTKIHTLGYIYRQKVLFSNPDNWLRMIEMIQEIRASGNLVAVIIHLTERALFWCSRKEFIDVWKLLLLELKQCKSLIFIYEDNLSGVFSEWDITWDDLYGSRKEALERYWSGDPDEELDEYIKEMISIEMSGIDKEKQEKAPFIKKILREIYNSGVIIAPYRRRIDIASRFNEFLEEIDQGIFFRLYVPNGKYQSEQLNEFLKLFESYLRQIEGKLFSIDTRRTDHGTVYIFRSTDNNVSTTDLDEAISRFESFMNLCQSDPQSAEITLVRAGIDRVSGSYLISKYAREYQRLTMDIRHEFEHKLLLLRQRFEGETFEFRGSSLLPFPQPEQPSSLLSLSQNTGPVTISIGTISVNGSTNSSAYIGHLINGNITYTQEDKKLIELFNEYADKITAIHLKSELEQLKDQTTPKETKSTARQKIVSFLYTTASTVGNKALETSIQVLIDYLAKLTTGVP